MSTGDKRPKDYSKVGFLNFRNTNNDNRLSQAFTSNDIMLSHVLGNNTWKNNCLA